MSDLIHTGTAYDICDGGRGEGGGGDGGSGEGGGEGGGSNTHPTPKAKIPYSTSLLSHPT